MKNPKSEASSFERNSYGPRLHQEEEEAAAQGSPPAPSPERTAPLPEENGRFVGQKTGGSILLDGLLGCLMFSLMFIGVILLSLLLLYMYNVYFFDGRS